MSSDRTPPDVIAELLDAHRDDPYSTAEPVSLPGIADLCQERGEHKSASAIRRAVRVLASRQRFYAVQLGDECGWVVMSDDPINGTPVWRFDEFPPDPSRGEKAHRLARLLNTAAGFRVSPIPDDNTQAEVAELIALLRGGWWDDTECEHVCDLLAAAYLDGQPQDRPDRCPTCGSDDPAVCAAGAEGCNCCPNTAWHSWHVGGSGDTR